MNTIQTATPVFLPVTIELAPATNNHKRSDLKHWHICNNQQMVSVIEGLKRAVKLDTFTQVLDTSLALASSFLATHAGTAPSNFPIFSTHFGGIHNNPETITIEQNCVEAATLSEFVSLFVQSSKGERPHIKFEYNDRPTSLNTLSKLSNTIRLFQNFKGEDRLVEISDREVADSEIIAFAMSGNHLPSLNRYIQGDQSILLGWAAAKSAKLHDTRDRSQKIIKETILKVSSSLQSSLSENLEFWQTLYVQLLLDLALVTDGAPSEIQQAITLARQIDNSALIAHCQRFCNQTLGVSREALATLDDSINRFRQIPNNSEEAIIFTPSKLGAILNRTTTAFIASTDAIDPVALEADYMEAREIFPSYSSLGMLASSAAVGRMIKGHHRRAVELLEKASLERSLPIDNFNIRINLICAQFLHSGSYENVEFNTLIDHLKSFKFLPTWEYHKVRICLNLMTVAKCKEHREAAWNLIRNSHFLSELKNENDDLAVLRQHLVHKKYNHYLIGNRIGGHFGKFVERTDLFPAIDKDWT